MSLIARLAAALGEPPPATLLAGDDHLHEGHAIPAAVLVAIVERAEPTVLFTVRHAELRLHGGQIAFPGGRIDPGDADATAAALREADEEIGLPPGLVRPIGIADRYRTVTGFDITPVVAVVPAGLMLVPHAAEVAEIFEVPLAFLLDPANQLARTMEHDGRTRRYYELLWRDHRIWGATAAMIVNLTRRMSSIVPAA